MKLFTVTVEFDYVVVADSEDEAEHVARKTVKQALSDLDFWDLNYIVEPGVHAYGWDDNCIPYGGDGNTRTKEYKNGN